MSVYIDRKYLLLISNKLDRFSKKKDDLFNFRCPFCGDSEKNKYKARGFIYREKDDYFYRCHNCGTSHNFYNFLKFVDPTKLNEYRIETFVDRGDYKELKPRKIEKNDDKCIHINLPTIESLDEKHYAKNYVLTRKIPEKYHKILYFCDNFKKFVSEITDEKFELYEDDSRLVIPFFNSKNEVIYIQGRSLRKSNLKYITISLTKNYPKIFGLDRVNLNRRVYVLEGPIDSLFVDNSIATADSDLTKSDILNIQNSVLIYDNEPRSKIIVNKIEKAINSNHAVCLFPDYIKEKDINEQIISGRSPEKIKKLIEEFTFSGLRAKLEFMKWRKV